MVGDYNNTLVARYQELAHRSGIASLPTGEGRGEAFSLGKTIRLSPKHT